LDWIVVMESPANRNSFRLLRQTRHCTSLNV